MDPFEKLIQSFHVMTLHVLSAYMPINHAMCDVYAQPHDLDGRSYLSTSILYLERPSRDDRCLVSDLQCFVVSCDLWFLISCNLWFVDTVPDMKSE